MTDKPITDEALARLERNANSADDEKDFLVVRVGEGRALIARIRAAEAERERLREALRGVMVGGNHLVSLIDAPFDWPRELPPGTNHEIALGRLHATPSYDAWCCWNAIMLARAALENPNG